LIWATKKAKRIEGGIPEIVNCLVDAMRERLGP